ncbi:4-hydroxy-3-methylbut-2-enyl diphosphate reductase [Gammaproteobacteria bacterium]|jgi:4-hydroxy-3-methylbut-2-enyl diphosphate reductase|nr:4-hydroxy-3-methylbut-2-enyl diphosphate reductase [SAR86 cluster bacterium]MDA8709550.1 4-hydroxy-3-methylbut-2-enyl diphosphate reductase [Gammaproteobacteria bacterium]MBL6701456.1 4-hydroxy-3-methylbut-2-enyl diphosphate reductase [SAR86 cluster bacterium]MDA8799523.1 4-hydroxy-3-methylbut-2-enyl diphosphate reductase [Gammaproteobacteria bacterium]MDB2370574.1 4-hydroxy-3-methylbut-2-enyl diphosphate reductase [Gammaproteobacteria bacterium]|tara:strand:- start:481 stop:1422 length:942 start_codon:yes stop_codon:yes gene_type:complete
MKTKVLLANPRGFCAGVDRAIDIVNQALKKFGPPIYVRHEVVHNKTVVEELKSKGVIFVDELSEVPQSSHVIFSAHGVSEKVEKEAAAFNLLSFDATCPLVTKVHSEVQRHVRAGRDIILIGHEGHPEVEGTLGRHNPIDSISNIYLVQDEREARLVNVSQPENLAYVTQTTLSLDDTISIVEILYEQFPKILKPKSDDICYATQNRQDAVKQLALESEFIIVIGSRNSSNSNRLKELAEKCGASSILIDGADELDFEILSKYKSIGITAGASAPESIVQNVVQAISLELNAVAEELGKNKENIYFRLPPELR